MHTQSGLEYEIFGDIGYTIVTCTCWSEVSPVARHLDTHWLQKLAKELKIIITNRRGFAGSSGHSTLEEEVLGLSEVVDIVGTPAILLGGCEAAVVPIAYAARHTEEVKALIVVNGTARFTADTNYPGYPKEEMLESIDHYRENWEGFFRPFLTEVAPIPWTDIDTLFNLLQRNVTNEAMAALVEELNLVDIRSELANVKCPTLIIHSTDDQVIPFSQAQYLASHITNSKLHRLENADHHINPAYNDEIVQVIDEFVRSI